MMDERIAELISRKLSGEASPGEIRELQEYLQNNPGDQYFAELLSSYWSAAPEVLREPVSEHEAHFEQILRLAGKSTDQDTMIPEPETPLVSRKKRTAWIKWMAAAAVVILIAMSPFFYFQPGRPAIGADIVHRKNEVIAKRGARSHLELPDGSKVWLNSDSKLSYTDFNDSTREVELEGEGFFDVVKDPARPFIVHTSGIAVHVLGTAFNVKSYPDEPIIETTLIRGLIEVKKNNHPDAPKVILHPHEKLVFNKRENSMIRSTDRVSTVLPENQKQPEDISITALPKNIADSSLKETAWIYDRLLFDGDSFGELSNKMERWFNVRIILKNDKLAGQRLHGSFENETIEQAMEALQLMTPFKYKINGNEIEIDKK